MSRFASILSACLISGCVSNIPTKPSPLLLNNHWTVPTIHTIQAPAKNITCMAWWKQFHDPTLNRLMHEAFINNDNLNMARARIEAALGEYKKIQYQWIPGLDFLGGYSRNPAYGYPGFWYALIPSYALNAFQQIAEQKRAKYQLLETKMLANAIQLTVIAEIASSYFTYQAERERRQLLKTLAKDSAELAQISDHVTLAGIASDIIPLQPKSTAELVYAQQEVIERNIVFSRNSILYLIEKLHIFLMMEILEE